MNASMEPLRQTSGRGRRDRANAHPPVRQYKAYHARSYDGESDCIVFALRNSMAARRDAAGRMSGDLSDVESLTRAPQFDALVDRIYIEARDYIERGWWLQCSGCFRRVELEMDCSQIDAASNLEASYHVLHPQSAWCSAGCRDRDLLDRFRRRVAAVAEFTHWSAEAQRRWPGISRLSVSRQDSDRPDSVEIRFQAPGFPDFEWATWRPHADEERQLLITRGAHSAWLAYVGSLPSEERSAVALPPAPSAGRGDGRAS